MAHKQKLQPEEKVAIVTLLHQVYMIFAPNGNRASFAILKHWSPKGMPMIVIHSSKPLNSAANAKGIPLKIIHRTFARKDKVLPPYSTSLPKGKKARVASLKHCWPIGIPMIVILHKTPASPHERPCHRPPHKNHITFPKQPIHLPSLYSEDVPPHRKNPNAVRPIIPQVTMIQ